MSTISLVNQQIPVPSTTLVGRGDELARLKTLLGRADVRLLTLMGPGGVGKTRLAIHLAHEAEHAMDNEIHFVLLANAIEADAVLPAIARSLGVSQTGPLPLEALVIDAIGERRIQLFLDNAEQVAPHLTFLSNMLASCPGLRIVVTSQVMLRLSAEHVFPVDPLPTSSTNPKDLAPASALFVERARAVHPDLDLSTENLRAIDDICRQIDGLPLAIELAAARTRFLSPVVLRDRLCERLNFLIGGPRDAPERHRTLRATLSWSHDLLSPDERILFRRLAVFEQGGPWDAIGAVCNAAGDLGGDVEEILTALADHSLVRIFDTPSAGPRVRLLNTIREFALEQLELSGERDALSVAHAHWFSRQVIETPVETWRTGTAELRRWTLHNLPEVDNFSATIACLLEHGKHATALRMVTWLVPFWLEVGQLREITRWINLTLPYAEQLPLGERSHAFRMAAIMEFKDNNLEHAEAHAAHAVALAQEVGEPRPIANCLNLHGQIVWRMGNPDEGERLQRAAITTMEHASDPLGGALFASQIAESLIEYRELDRAEALLREAMPIVERERPEALPMLQGSLGYLLLLQGNVDEATGFLERSLDYHVAPPHRLPSMLAGRLLTIGEVAIRRGLPLQAARLLGASLGICQRIGIVIDRMSMEDVNRLTSSIRTAIGGEALDREVMVGRTLSIPQALDLALEITSQRTGPDGSDGEPLADNEYDLTPREMDVLTLLAQGKSNPAIAEDLFISQRTVTTHLSRLYAKLDVSTRSEAIALAMRMGLVTPGTHRT